MSAPAFGPPCEHARWIVMTPDTGFASREEAVAMATRNGPPAQGTAIVCLRFTEGEGFGTAFGNRDQETAAPLPHCGCDP